MTLSILKILLILLIYYFDFTNLKYFISFVDFLYSYENKPSYQCHHLIHTFPHPNKISSNSMQFTLNSFHFFFFFFFFLSFFLLKKAGNSLCLIFLTTFLFTPFPFLTYSSSTAINEYIFDFNSTNSLSFFPLNSSLILPINFLLTGSKKFEFT